MKTGEGSDRLPWICVVILYVIVILMSLSTCQVMERRESDWRRWKEEAEELGYNRGYEDGYTEGYSDAESERQAMDSYRRGVLDGWEEGYAAGLEDNA